MATNPKWVNLLPSAPADKTFATTGGLGTPINIDDSSAFGYYLNKSGVVKILGGALLGYPTRVALASAPTAIGYAYLTEPGREGAFVWSSANLLAQVTADTQQGIYVPPTGQDGSTGAWVRKYTGGANVLWFGAVGDRVANDYPAIQGAINTVLAAGGGAVYLPGGKFYRITTGLLATSATDAIIPLSIESGPAAYLDAVTAIDMLTVSNTAGAGNSRFMSVKNLGFVVNDVGARGLVLTNAAYNQFVNLDMLGSGTMIVCGAALNARDINNQFSNIRITGPGNGIYIGGLYNLFTNISINEGITGQYAIYIDGQYCVVSDFVARGSGGSGGTATIFMSSFSAGSVLAHGTVLDSYAVGVHVQGADGQRVEGVSIVNSQTHGLQLAGNAHGTFDVTITNSSQALANTYNNINCLFTPTDCLIKAHFIGTQALLDISEGTGANNTWIANSLPNGKSILGTGSTLMLTGSYSINGLQVLGPRKTGWAVDTGTAKRTANATYSGTASAAYTQAELQTLMDKVRDLSQTIKALKDDLHNTAGHGLIGT